jgi:hypothetical protein
VRSAFTSTFKVENVFACSVEFAHMTVDPVDECADSTQPCAWNPRHSERWRQEVDSWPWQSVGAGEWQKNGTCPRCKHDMWVTWGGGPDGLDAEEQVQILLEARVDTDEFLLAAAAEGLKLAWCTCQHQHPDRPKELDRGCGQNGLVSPPKGAP